MPLPVNRATGVMIDSNYKKWIKAYIDDTSSPYDDIEKQFGIKYKPYQEPTRSGNNYENTKEWLRRNKRF